MIRKNKFLWAIVQNGKDKNNWPLKEAGYMLMFNCKSENYQKENSYATKLAHYYKSKRYLKQSKTRLQKFTLQPRRMKVIGKGGKIYLSPL